MKAISIHQPWASLISLCENRFETRNWKPRHRGPIIIHASKSFSKAEQALLQTEPFNSVLARHGIESITQLPTGRPVAIATLKDAYFEILDDLLPPCLFQRPLAAYVAWALPLFSPGKKDARAWGQVRRQLDVFRGGWATECCALIPGFLA